MHAVSIGFLDSAGGRVQAPLPLTLISLGSSLGGIAESYQGEEARQLRQRFCPAVGTVPLVYRPVAAAPGGLGAACSGRCSGSMDSRGQPVDSGMGSPSGRSCRPRIEQICPSSCPHRACQLLPHAPPLPCPSLPRPCCARCTLHTLFRLPLQAGRAAITAAAAAAQHTCCVYAHVGCGVVVVEGGIK